MNSRTKNILTYATIGVFFALTPYWALGQNINDLRSDLQKIESSNAVLSEKIDENMSIEDTYSQAKEKLEQQRLVEVSPAGVVEEAISILSEDGSEIESLKQEKLESSTDSLEIWLTYVYLKSYSLPSLETLEILNSLENTQLAAMKSSVLTGDVKRSEIVLETIIVN